MPESLFTPVNAYRRVLATNAAASAYTARSDTTTAPSSSLGESAGGYVLLPSASNTVVLKPYGAGSDDQTGSVRVYGVKAIEKAGSATSYTHVLLGDWSFTLSTAVGVSGGVVGASERYADTITRTTGVENVADQIVSPTGNVAGHIMVDCKGHSTLLVELIVGTATSVNALYAGV